MNRQIIWSPQLNDKPWFVIGGGDLRLYEYSQQDKRDIFTLLHTNSDLSLMKCISWAKTSSYNDLMGIGMSNGRAVVQSLTYPSEFNVSFVPRHARACNAVDFSPDSSLLVTGLEKVRNDYSLSLWNIEKVEIINQYGPSETISSLSFFEGYPNLLVAGMNGKWIRIYDTRTPGNCFVLSSKAVNGISIDPFFYTQFSSFTDDGLIKIYDFRNSSGEILSINTNESRIGLESIAYSKDRKGLITCLTKDSNFIRLYDVKTGETSTEIIEPIFNNPDNNSNVPNVPTGNFDSDLWRSRASNCLSFTISSYCFIPGLNSFLAIGNSGPIIEKIQIVEPCKLSWGGYGCAILSDNETPGGIDILDNCILSPLEISDEISIIMINRAKKGYCLDSSVNQTLVSGGLKEAWCWLERMASLSEQGRLFIGNTDFSYQGISSILLQAWTLASSKRSGATQTLWNSSSPSSSLPKYVPSESILSPNDYLSTNIQRAVALDLINLPFRNLDHWILQLVDQKSYYKAAAWALFSSNFSLCIESLKASPTDSDKMISACIISYSLNSSSFSSSSMWNDICSSISKESKDPYIRAMFTFIGSSGNLHLVLEEKDLPLIDKISIALYFLDDKNMITFLTKLTNRVILLGDIEGLVLTGFSFPHSIDLLQNYLDNTGDIQTISAFSCHFPPKLFKFINLESVNVKASSKQKEWIETYRDLLDHWRLFHERCQFDIERRSLFFSSKNETETQGIKPVVERQLTKTFSIPPQIYVKCNYCNQSLAQNANIIPGMSSLPSGGWYTKKLNSNQESLGSHFSKSSSLSCSSCRKPVSKCSVCVLPLGIRTDTGTTMDQWWSWCQTCKHGGHSNHIQSWFEKHQVCPVSDCSCSCQYLF